MCDLLDVGIREGQRLPFRIGCLSHRQEVVVHGELDWESDGKIPMYYLENATGKLDFLVLAEKHPEKIEGRPLHSIDEVLSKLRCSGLNENFLISLWEPELARCRQNYNLNATVRDHKHLMGFFANTSRGWRDPSVGSPLGEKEISYYKLFSHASEVSKSAWAERYLQNPT